MAGTRSEQDQAKVQAAEQEKAAAAEKARQEGAKKAAEEVAKEQEKARVSAEERRATEAAPVGPPPSVQGAAGSAPAETAVEEGRYVAGAEANKMDGEINPVAVGVGLQSRTGERTGGVEDEQGNQITDLESVIDRGDGTRTYVVVTKRLFESFVQPGTTTKMTRLLLPANTRLSLDRAEALKAAING